tara:strand:- start:399 stop:575 length:177 start_codon:yes stop_codon:yes gene_type:complete
MEIKVWYSKGIKQWRWSLMDIESRRQESGQQYHIRDAMNDIATTIEYMVEKRQYEGQD